MAPWIASLALAMTVVDAAALVSDSVRTINRGMT
jgi:hypothetical protein